MPITKDQQKACESFYQPDFEQVAKKRGIEKYEDKDKWKDFLIIVAIAILAILFYGSYIFGLVKVLIEILR